ncbi:MAG: hypothetical protein KAG12_05210, partial [Desulfuromusa sp.]|nr:hypothetical protein [Desulfuromusa sp.]
QIAGLSSELEQDLYLKELAKRSGIDLGQLQQVNKEVASRGQKRKKTYATATLPEEYPLPEPPMSEPAGGSYSGRARTVKAAPGWSRTEETLLCLLLQNYVSRKKIMAAGGLELFSHRDAQEMARLLFDNATDSGLEIENLIGKLDPEKVPLLMGLSMCDQGQFSENVDALFDGCLKALKREQKKLQRNELHEKIRQYEQGKDSENLNHSLKEFTNLK